MDSIIRFLREDILPEEKIEADKIRRKATSYWLSEDHKLYKRFFSRPYLLCVYPDLTESLLEELHEGAYFLEDLDEHVVPCPWNVNNLKRYYY